MHAYIRLVVVIMDNERYSVEGGGGGGGVPDITTLGVSSDDRGQTCIRFDTLFPLSLNVG